MDKEILQRAIDTYGTGSQKDMIIEEALELALAILKHRRSVREGKTPEQIEKWRDNIVEERTDVGIMLEQVDIMFDCKDEVEEIQAYKINRLKERLENDE